MYFPFCFTDKSQINPWPAAARAARVPEDPNPVSRIPDFPLIRAVHRPKPVQNFVIRAGIFILFFEPGR